LHRQEKERDANKLFGEERIKKCEEKKRTKSEELFRLY